MQSKVGRKIYFDKLNGNIILDTGEHIGIVKTTVEKDILTYNSLSRLNRDTFDVLELDFGQYAQDFIECVGYRVNVETKTLEFSYPNSNEPTVEQPYQAPLSEKVKQLELAQSVTDTTLLELMESLLQ